MDTNQIKYKKKVYTLKKHREVLTAQQLNRSRPIMDSPISQEEDKYTQQQKKQKNSYTLLLFTSHQLVRYESSSCHKIDRAKSKQTWNEHGRRKSKQGK